MRSYHFLDPPSGVKEWAPPTKSANLATVQIIIFCPIFVFWNLYLCVFSLTYLYICAKGNCLIIRSKTNIDIEHHNKDMGGSQCDNDSSPNLSFNDRKQKEIEIK